MALTTQTVGVTTAAGLLVTANKGSVSDPQPCVLYTASSGVFIGGSNVTTSTGVPLAANTPFSLSLIQGDDVWAIGTGSINVIVLRGRN